MTARKEDPLFLRGLPGGDPEFLVSCGPPAVSGDEGGGLERKLELLLRPVEFGQDLLQEGEVEGGPEALLRLRPLPVRQEDEGCDLPGDPVSEVVARGGEGAVEARHRLPEPPLQEFSEVPPLLRARLPVPAHLGLELREVESVRDARTLGLPKRPAVEVHVVQLEREGPVEDLGAEHVGRLVDVDGSGEEDVAGDPEAPGHASLSGSVLVSFLMMQAQGPTGLQRREEVGEVVLDVGEVHLVEDDEEGASRAVFPLRRGLLLPRPHEQAEEARRHVFADDRIVIPDEPPGVGPVRAHRDDEDPARRPARYFPLSAFGGEELCDLDCELRLPGAGDPGQDHDSLRLQG